MNANTPKATPPATPKATPASVPSQRRWGALVDRVKTWHGLAVAASLLIGAGATAAVRMSAIASKAELGSGLEAERAIEKQEHDKIDTRIELLGERLDMLETADKVDRAFECWLVCTNVKLAQRLRVELPDPPADMECKPCRAL